MTVRTWGQHPVDIGIEMNTAGLSRDARTLYLLLPMTSRILPCGLLELTERRWATETAMTLAEVEDALRELASTPRASSGTTWILIDWDTAELLIPTHLRDDGSLRNPKRRKGVTSSIDKITSPTLRAAAVERLEQHPDWPSDDDLSEKNNKQRQHAIPNDPGPAVAPSEPAATELAPSADEETDCPIDHPTDWAMDSPWSSTLNPGSLSSSSADGFTTRPDPPPDDDDPAAAALHVQRARAACALLGTRDYERAVLDQVPIGNHRAYLHACQQRATDDTLIAAIQAAHDDPTATPEELADQLDLAASALGAIGQALTAGRGPGPAPPRHHVPLDPAAVEAHTSHHNGAPVIDITAARAAANT